jgi:rod shape-determining protein MreC
LKIAKTYKIFFLLLLISFCFVIGNLPFFPFKKITGYLTFPINRFKYSVRDIQKLEAKNRELSRKLSLYEIEKINMEEVLKENERLRARLNLNLPSSSWGIIWAQIQEVYSQELLLDKGAADGVKEGFPVFSDNTVVGRISRVWQNKAKVTLLIHSNFSVGTKLVRSGLEGVGEGLPLENAIQLRYIPKRSDIKKKDEVVTSGRGGLFPSGIKVGEVCEVIDEPFGFFFKIKVKPALKLSEIQDVVILVKTLK